MADATPGDTSSTPTAAAVAPSATAPAQATPSSSATPAASAAPAPATTPSPATPTPAATDSPPATAAATADTTPTAEPTTAATAPTSPAFTLPTDLKLAPEAVSQFETFLKAKTVDAEGKFTMTAQELIDNYATQARTAFQRWQSQLAEQNTTWEAESKARFTAPQLAAAETGIGFLTSFEPEFRELAKSFRNNPSFVNAMRVVGERLSEDTFEIAGAPPPQPSKRAAKDVMYPKRATN